jgi:hypothetical protein
LARTPLRQLRLVKTADVYKAGVLAGVLRGQPDRTEFFYLSTYLDAGGLSAPWSLPRRAQAHTAPAAAVPAFFAYLSGNGDLHAKNLAMLGRMESHRFLALGRSESCLVGGPERSWVVWSPGDARLAARVLRRGCGCPRAVRSLGFLVRCPARPAAAGAGRTAESVALSRPSSGGRKSHLSRRRARWPSERLPMTTADAWWAVTAGENCCRSGASQC